MTTPRGRIAPEVAARVADLVRTSAGRDRAARAAGSLCAAAWAHCRAAGPDLEGDVSPPRPRFCPAHAPDEALVDRAVYGLAPEPVLVSPSERVEVVRRMSGRGESDAAIAARVGCTIRTVQRDRAEHGIPAGVPATAGQWVTAAGSRSVPALSREAIAS